MNKVDDPGEIAALLKLNFDGGPVRNRADSLVYTGAHLDDFLENLSFLLQISLMH